MASLATPEHDRPFDWELDEPSPDSTTAGALVAIFFATLALGLIGLVIYSTATA